MTKEEGTSVIYLSEDEFNLFEKNKLTFLRESDKVRTSLRDDVQNAKVRPEFRSEKTLRRESHLELLMFSLLDFVVEQLEELTEGACCDAPAFVEVRDLSKSLARGRRPDGSKY